MASVTAPAPAAHVQGSRPRASRPLGPPARPPGDLPVHPLHGPVPDHVDREHGARPAEPVAARRPQPHPARGVARRLPSGDRRSPPSNPVDFVTLAFNSFKIASLTSLFSILIGVSAAYAFSRFKFAFRAFLMILILGVLMLPAVATLAPLFVFLNGIRVDFTGIPILGPLLGNFNLRNSLLGVMLAITSGLLPFAIWNLKGYLDTIPQELEEAAAVDGASRNATFFKIILPLATPALAVTGFLGFIGGWTEFYFSWMFLTKPSDFTLAMALYSMVGQLRADDAVVAVRGVRDPGRDPAGGRLLLRPEVHRVRPRDRRREGLSRHSPGHGTAPPRRGAVRPPPIVSVDTPAWVRDAVFYQVFPDRFAAPRARRAGAARAVGRAAHRARLQGRRPPRHRRATAVPRRPRRHGALPDPDLHVRVEPPLPHGRLLLGRSAPRRERRRCTS